MGQLGRLHPEVQDHIRSLSNESLADYIAAGPETYRPEAIDFALEEFTRRNLNLGKLANLRAAAILHYAEKAAVNPEEQELKPGEFLRFFGISCIGEP